MKSEYPLAPSVTNAREVERWMQEIVRLRQAEDLPDFTNLTSIFVQGRNTNRIPSSAADVLATDNKWDFVYAADGSYLYILVDSSGTLTWGRITVNVAW